MSVKKLILILMCLMSASQLAFSKSDSECLGMQNDITLMIQVRDYSSILKATEAILRDCKQYMEKYSDIPHLSDMERYFGYYGVRSEAYLGLGRFEEALKTSQECINKKYSTVDCHLAKWKSLMRLQRYGEAEEYKKTVYLIIQNKVNLVEQINFSLYRKELQPSLNELKRAEIEKLGAYKDFLDRSY